MKQPEDNATLDMYGDEQPPEKKSARYRFHIELDSGETVWWTGLTHAKAVRMNQATYTCTPSNVVSFGWEAIE